jgi:hypothetical protein
MVSLVKEVVVEGVYLLHGVVFLALCNNCNRDSIY